jgi:hypothetical protein
MRITTKLGALLLAGEVCLCIVALIPACVSALFRLLVVRARWMRVTFRCRFVRITSRVPRRRACLPLTYCPMHCGEIFRTNVPLRPVFPAFGKVRYLR